MIKTIKDNVKLCTCDSCSHSWKSLATNPAMCPKCRSRYWNGQKQKPKGRPPSVAKVQRLTHDDRCRTAPNLSPGKDFRLLESTSPLPWLGYLVILYSLAGTGFRDWRLSLCTTKTRLLLQTRWLSLLPSKRKIGKAPSRYFPDLEKVKTMTTETKAAQHELGPWRDTGELSRDSSTCGSYTTTIESEERFLAVVYGKDKSSCIANARLIAACPTMYDYINKKAGEGDAEAQSIIAAI